MVQASNPITILCIFTLCLACITSNAIPAKASYFEKLVISCPSVRNNSVFEKIAPKCTISAQNDKLDTSCKLYFHVFTSYCAAFNKVEPSFHIDEETQSLTPQQVCKDWGIVPRTENRVELVKSLFPDENCVGFCSNELDMTSPVCTLAYFLSNKINNNAVKKSTAEEVSSQSASSTQKILPSSTNGVIVSKNESTVQTVGNKSLLTDLAAKIPVLKATEKPALVKPSTSKEEPAPPVPEVSVEQTDANNPPPEAAIASNAEKTLQDTEPKAEKKQEAAEEATKAATPASAKPKSDNGQDYVPEIAAAEPPQNAERVPVDDINEEGVPGDDSFEDELLTSNIDGSKSTGKATKPVTSDESDPGLSYATDMDGDSYFFTYFMVLCIVFVVGYVCYHNKQKILALILEGRRGRKQYRGRRPNSANYHKLDSNLEEAITSSCSKNPSNVIY